MKRLKKYKLTSIGWFIALFGILVQSPFAYCIEMQDLEGPDQI